MNYGRVSTLYLKSVWRIRCWWIRTLHYWSVSTLQRRYGALRNRSISGSSGCFCCWYRGLTGWISYSLCGESCCWYRGLTGWISYSLCRESCCWYRGLTGWISNSLGRKCWLFWWWAFCRFLIWRLSDVYFFWIGYWKVIKSVVKCDCLVKDFYVFKFFYKVL